MNRKTINKSDWSDEKIQLAKQIWQNYQKSHDVSDRKGQAAGIDPETGEVWFGEDITAITRKRRLYGLFSPLFFERVGYPTYLCKVGKRVRRIDPDGSNEPRLSDQSPITNN